MTKDLYIKAITVVLFVAVPFNVIRLFSDMYGAAVIAILQLFFAKQIYNFMAGKDMSFGGAFAGKDFSFDVRVFVSLCFVLMYFGLFLFDRLCRTTDTSASRLVFMIGQCLGLSVLMLSTFHHLITRCA